MNIIEWIINKKQIEEQMEKDDRDITNLRHQVTRKVHEIKELEYLREQNEKNILTIKELRKTIRKLKKELKVEIEK